MSLISRLTSRRQGESDGSEFKSYPRNSGFLSGKLDLHRLTPPLPTLLHLHPQTLLHHCLLRLMKRSHLHSHLPQTSQGTVAIGSVGPKGGQTLRQG